MTVAKTDTVTKPNGSLQRGIVSIMECVWLIYCVHFESSVKIQNKTSNVDTDE